MRGVVRGCPLEECAWSNAWGGAWVPVGGWQLWNRCSRVAMHSVDLRDDLGEARCFAAVDSDAELSEIVIASAHDNGQVVLWNAKEGAQLLVLGTQYSPARTLCFFH
eukprot:gene3494-4389_t